MKALVLVVCVIGMHGCASRPITLRTPPADALAQAALRLVEQGITLDETGTTVERRRTQWYCYTPPGPTGTAWQRSFARPHTGPAPSTVEGDDAEQTLEREQCSHIFRIVLETRRIVLDAPDKGATLTAGSEWYRKVQRGCVPAGNPLVGRLSCTYGWDGASAVDDPSGYIYVICAGL